MELSTLDPNRDWKDIAREMVNEPDRQKRYELSVELDTAMQARAKKDLFGTAIEIKGPSLSKNA
jgi:hypothetical protein